MSSAVTVYGPPGNIGLSAYEVAVANGFEGTEQDFIDSLQGEVGPPGSAGPQGPGLLVLDDQEAIPGGTPAGTVIFRRPPA